MNQFLIAVISAALTLSSLFFGLHWKWVTDVKRGRRESRIRAIGECRDYISKNDFDQEEFCANISYSQLRSNFSEKLIDEIENWDPKNHNTDSNKLRAHIKYRILDEIAAIERKWRII